MAISVALFLEYEYVLTRPDILAMFGGITRDEVLQTLDYIATLATHIQPTDYRVKPALPDPNDEMVLECAINSQSDFLVTLNKKDFKDACPRYKLGLVQPGEFLKIVRVE